MWPGRNPGRNPGMSFRGRPRVAPANARLWPEHQGVGQSIHDDAQHVSGRENQQCDQRRPVAGTRRCSAATAAMAATSTSACSIAGHSSYSCTALTSGTTTAPSETRLRGRTATVWRSGSRSTTSTRPSVARWRSMPRSSEVRTATRPTVPAVRHIASSGYVIPMATSLSSPPTTASLRGRTHGSRPSRPRRSVPLRTIWGSRQRLLAGAGGNGVAVRGTTACF